MGRCRPGVYRPDPTRHRAYDELYAVYIAVHDYFGRERRELMRALQSMRERAAAAEATP